MSLELESEAIEDEYYDETDNELNLLDFRVGGSAYCINILKIKEIIALKSVEIVELPHAEPAVLGIFPLRDTTIPLVDLTKFFGSERKEDKGGRSVVLVCEFNQAITGFLVESTGGIRRMTWDDIKPVGAIGKGESAKYVTGRVSLDGKIFLLLDFERILAEINGDPYHLQAIGAKDIESKPTRASHTVYMAEDSPMIRDIMAQTLRNAGYGQVMAFDDGESAYEALKKAAPDFGMGGAKPPVSLLVTDIEMPRMDGLTLCRKVRRELGLAALPVIVFSSMISEQMAVKIRDVGATDYISKPKKEDLLGIVDKHCLGQQAAPA